MDRRCFLKIAAAAPLLLSFASGASAAPRRISYPLVSREFLLLGRGQLFAVHRLQYAPGHNFQLALRLRMPDRLPRAWRRARRRGELALLRTTAMDLRGLRPGPARESARTRSLIGSVLALDGSELMGSREWPVQAIQVYAEVDPQQARSHELEYFLFGHLREWYGMHVIGGAPDFEQIVALPRLPDDDRLRVALDNTAVNARQHAGERRELHFATLPTWSA